MYKKYKTYNQTQSIYRIEDNSFIPLNEDNTDYQEYLKWVSEGNIAEEVNQ